MCDPPCHEKHFRRLRKILRPYCTATIKLPHMIQRHDDHDDATKDVDGGDAGWVVGKVVVIEGGRSEIYKLNQTFSEC